MWFYRRRLNKKSYKIWHFHRKCPDFPFKNAYNKTNDPEKGEICPTCIRLHKSQKLRKSFQEERVFSRYQAPPDILDLSNADED